MDETIFATLKPVNCPRCGVLFGLEKGHQDVLWRKGTDFYCPNGHAQGYYQNTDAKKLARTEQLLAAERARHDQTRADRDAAKRRASAARGQVTKIRNRVGNGVCPCCNRSFENLRRHMATKHPEWKEPTDGR